MNSCFHVSPFSADLLSAALYFYFSAFVNLILSCLYGSSSWSIAVYFAFNDVQELDDVAFMLELVTWIFFRFRKASFSVPIYASFYFNWWPANCYYLISRANIFITITGINMIKHISNRWNIWGLFGLSVDTVLLHLPIQMACIYRCIMIVGRLWASADSTYTSCPTSQSQHNDPALRTAAFPRRIQPLSEVARLRRGLVKGAASRSVSTATSARSDGWWRGR